MDSGQGVAVVSRKRLARGSEAHNEALGGTDRGRFAASAENATLPTRLTMADLTDVSHPYRATTRRTPFTVSADRGWVHRFQLAATDMREGARLWRLAWELGFADIRLRYRGSVLGPLWLTISTAIMVGAMAFLYAVLFHTDVHTYLPYLTVSIVFWNYLSSMITDGCGCFISADALIRSARMPFTLHAMRSIVRNTIILGHNLIVIIGLFIIMRRPVELSALWAIPAIFLWLLNGLAISLLLGAFCARFRDVPQIVAALMQIAFFLTPIMFYPNAFQGHARVSLLMHLNPFLYILGVLRAPILGTPLSIRFVAMALVVTVAVVIVSALGFVRARGRIAYWV